jgi:hypothetical protein
MGHVPHLSAALLLLALPALGTVVGPRAMRLAARRWRRLRREEIRLRLEAAYAEYDPAA